MSFFKKNNFLKNDIYIYIIILGRGSIYFAHRNEEKGKEAPYSVEANFVSGRLVVVCGHIAAMQT